MQRRRNLRNYSVHELSLVLEPDIGRRAAIIKSKPNDEGVQLAGKVDEIIARINKSRLPPMDQMGNPIDDPNELSPAAVKAVQALARQLAMHRDEITVADLADIGRKVGLAPGDPAANDGTQDPNAQPGGAQGGSGLTANPDDAGNGSDDPGEDDETPDDGANNGADDDFPNDDEDAPEDGDEPGDDYDDAAAPEDDDDLNDESGTGDDGDGNDKMGWQTPAPDGVDPAHHSDAVANAKGTYLSALKKKGYDLSPKGDDAPPAKPTANKQFPPQKKPGADGKGKRAMANSNLDMVNKSTRGVDWSKFDAAQREQLEPVFKSLRATGQEAERLANENKELIEKHKSLESVVAKMTEDNERKELVEKTAALTHLTNHEAIVKSAMKIPAGEARDEFMESMKAQNAQIEEIKKAAGQDITRESGTRAGGDPMGTRGSDPVQEWNEMVTNYITKSAENGKAFDRGQAADMLMRTDAGKQAYERYDAAQMGRN